MLSYETTEHLLSVMFELYYPYLEPCLLSQFCSLTKAESNSVGTNGVQSTGDKLSMSPAVHQCTSFVFIYNRVHSIYICISSNQIVYM